MKAFVAHGHKLWDINYWAPILDVSKFTDIRFHARIGCHIKGHQMSLQVIKVLQRPSTFVINISHTNVSSKYLIKMCWKMSYQNVTSKFLIKMSHQMSHQICHQNISLKFLVKMCHQNVSSFGLIKIDHENIFFFFFNQNYLLKSLIKSLIQKSH